MRKIKNYILTAFTIAAVATSCDSYLDVNEDPNNPVLSQITPDLLLAGAQKFTTDTYVITANRLGSTLSGAWGGNVAQTADPFGNEFRYNITSTFFDGLWDNWFIRTANFSNIVNYSGEENYSNHKAIAKIQRAFYSQLLVDLYGDIPYFERHLYTELLQVPYDEDTVIYQDLIAELDSAIDMIANNTGAIEVGNEDAIFNGDMSLWTKFANTIKLRVVVRQSNVISTADAQTILAGLTDSDFIGFNEAVTFNPGYSKENDRQTPFYNSYGFSADGQSVRNQLIAPTIYSLEVLDGTKSSVNDPRLSTMFTTDNASGYTGIQQGQTLQGFDATNGISNLGTGFGVDADSEANATRDAIIMTVAESFFLQAEASFRGYLTSGNTQNSFDNGIRAHFQMLGNTPAEANTYIANINTVNGFGLAGGNQLEAIMMQKWIAMHTFGGVEAWLDMTRTGFPDEVPLPINQTRTERPVKLLYPNSELQGNTNNVPSIQNTDDAFVRTIFWN
jgi:hypothetical protein